MKTITKGYSLGYALLEIAKREQILLTNISHIEYEDGSKKTFIYAINHGVKKFIRL